MIVNLFQFSKRTNSTKLPAAGSGYELSNVVLKEPTDFLHPVIRITAAGIGGATVAPIVYNYAQIPKFSRYYFIDNWEYTGGCWECSLSIDVMGSWKASIGTMECYIDRSQSFYDSNVIDSLYPAKTNYSVLATGVSTPWAGKTVSGGCFILGVINDDTAGTRLGAVSYYALSNSQLGQVLGFMYGNSIWNASNITEISQGLYKSFFNPFQYIVSCIWIPLTVSQLTTTAKNVRLGSWDTGVSGNAVSVYNAQTLTVETTIPVHPQANSRGNYLNFAPYTNHTLYMPPFGAIPVDPAFKNHGYTLRGDVYVDIISGQATLRLGTKAPDNSVVYFTERSGVMGVPIQLAQVLADYQGVVNPILNSGSVTGFLTNLVTGTVMSAVEQNSPNVSTSGSNGSMITFVEASVLVSQCAILADENLELYGRPLLQNKVINTMSGYVKCAEAYVSFPCLLSEKERIEAFMKSGFYYE